MAYIDLYPDVIHRTNPYFFRLFIINIIILVKRKSQNARDDRTVKLMFRFFVVRPAIYNKLR